MNVLVFGAQGSGKSTHGKYIAEKLGTPYINTGDLFRNLEAEKSARGEKIRKLMREGILIPDDLAIPVVEEHIGKFDTTNGFVLDGFPRTVDQAKSFKFEINLVVDVTTSLQEAIRRLKLRGRYDDTPLGIKQRLELFHKNTEPVLKYFEEKKVKILRLDNTPAVELVRRKIDGAFEKQ